MQITTGSCRVLSNVALNVANNALAGWPRRDVRHARGPSPGLAFGRKSCGKGSATALDRMKHSGGRSQETRSANTMWGGRFSSSPSALMEAINASIGFDRRLASQDIAGLDRPQRPCWRKQGIIAEADRDAIHRGPAAGARRDRVRLVHLLDGARRHPHERREPAKRDRRRSGGAPPHGAQPQRPGRHSMSASGCATPMTGPTSSSRT